jgi:hypothetical protein
MAGKSDIGRNLRNAQKKRDKDKEDREKAAEKRQRQNEQRQRESEDRIGSRQPRKFTRPTDESSEGNRYSYKPKTPAKTTTTDESSESKRYSYKPKTPDRTSESERFSYKPKEPDRTSEANRYSYKPQDDSDDDDEDKPREWREPTQPAPRVLYDLAPAPSARDAVSLTSEPVDTGSSRFDTTSISPTTITSPTLRDWRGPVEGPRTREEAENRGGMGPQLPGAGAAIMGPLLTKPLEWGLRLTGQGDKADRMVSGAPRGELPEPGMASWASGYGWNRDRVGEPLPETTDASDPSAPYAYMLGRNIENAAPGSVYQPLGESAAAERYNYEVAEGLKDADITPGEWWDRTTGGIGRRADILGQAWKDWRSGEKGIIGAAMSLNDTEAPPPSPLYTIPIIPRAAKELDVRTLAFYNATQDYMNTRRLPGGESVGAAWASTDKALKDIADAEKVQQTADATGQSILDPRTAWDTFWKTYNTEVGLRRRATSPMGPQANPWKRADLTGADPKNWERAQLNFATPESIRNTYNALENREDTVEKYKEQAKRFTEAAQTATSEAERQQYAIAAADYGAEAYRLTNAHPIALVNQNTDVMAQLWQEIAQPDISDLFGFGIGAIGLSPAARRLQGVADRAAVPATKVAEDLSKIAVGPQTRKVLEGAAPDGRWNQILQRTVGYTGYSRAERAARDITNLVTTLVSDTDNAADIKTLLTTLARDPAQLIKGIPAEVFVSPFLRDRAVDGVVKFGAMGMNTKQFRESLNVFRTIADEFLPNSKVLNSEGAVNKADLLIGEFIPAMLQGGYRRYKVATDLGEAPVGAVRARTRTFSGGQAAVEYVDDKGKVLGMTDRMSLVDANRRATDYTRNYKKGGQQNATSFLKVLGDARRSVVTPMYIMTQPGTWATNLIGAVSMAAGDGRFNLGNVGDMQSTLQKIYGGVPGTRRSLEGASGSASAMRDMAGGPSVAGRGGIRGAYDKLKNLYGKIDETVGVPVDYNSTMAAIDKMLPPQLKEFVPVLQENGITDPKVIKSILNRLHETARTGGDMMAELNRALDPNTRLFNLSDVNARWMDVLPARSIEEMRGMVNKPLTKEQWAAEVEKWADRAESGWAAQLQEAPIVPQQHSWMKQENAQDLADMDQMNRLAQKNGVDLTDWKKQQAQELKEIEQRQEMLTQLVTESSDPKNRYILYNLWGQMYDRTASVRAELAQRVERTYELTAGLPKEDAAPIWQSEFFGPARQAWDERNAAVNTMLEEGVNNLRTGQNFAPNYDYWRRLERTAGQSTTALEDTLKIEPGAGRTDPRLAQVIGASRALVDKSVAETFLAARRFNTPGAFDQIISAEKVNQLAGAQASKYLSDMYEKLVMKEDNYAAFLNLRNEVWRQYTTYAQATQKRATRNIIAEGLSGETRTGMRWVSDSDGTVELLYPVRRDITHTVNQKPEPGQRRKPVKQTDTFDYWTVRREDGTITQIPDNAVPADLKKRYNGTTPEKIDAEIQAEMDNIASVEPYAADAQSIADRPPTETGIAGVWRTDEGDQPVRVIRSSGQNFEGNPTYRVQLPDGSIVDANMDELLIRTNDRDLRKLTDVDMMRQARQELDATEEALSRTDTRDATSARKDMRTAWNKDVSAKWKKAPSLDTLANRYWNKRTGMVVLPDNIKGIEDVYGSVVAGRRIEGQADVEALVQEYVDLLKQRGRMKGEEQKLRVQERDARTQYVEAENRRETISKEQAEQIRRDLNLGGSASVQDFEKTIATTTRNNTAMGGIAPVDSLGHAASHALQTIEQMKNYLLQHGEEILRPAGGTNEGGAMRILAEFNRRVKPEWDTIRQSASEYSTKQRSYTLLDATNKTRIDEMMSIFMPYSFFYTRTAKNALERMVFEPHIWRRVQQYKAAMTAEREQQGEPDRFGSAYRHVDKDGNVTYLNLNPTKYWPTVGSMLYNDYADPESAESALGFAMENAQMGGMNFYPDIDAGVKAWEGKEEDIYLPNYLPIGKIAAWGAAALWGHTPVPGGGGPMRNIMRPEFYEYNLKRELTTMVTEGKITEAEAMMAQDILDQERFGREPLPEQQEYFEPERLDSILDDAAKRAGWTQGTTALTSWLFGVGVKPFDTDEMAAIEANEAYWNRGYDATENPYGSRDAMSATMQENPELNVRWQQSASFDEDKDRPGIAAAETMMYDEKGGMFDTRQAARDAYLKDNFAATEEELNDATGEGAFWKSIEGLKEKYPSADDGAGGSGGVPQGMNPQERATWELEQFLAASKEGKPEYPEGGTDEEKKAYYAAKRDFDRQQLDLLEQELGRVLSDEVDPLAPHKTPAEWMPVLQEMIRGQYASELVRREGLQYASPIEREWSDWESLRQEMSQAEWAERTKQMEEKFAPEQVQQWKDYLAIKGDTPEGKAARAALREQYPYISNMNAYAFNPEEYAATDKQFGERWGETLQGFPEWPGDNATDAQKEAYNAAVDRYEQQNPQAIGLKTWVYGRNLPDMPEDYRYPNQYGTDYQEAQRLFGENIFKIAANVPDYETNKDAWIAYMNKHEKQLYGFWEWQKELKEMSPAEVAQRFPSEAEDADTATERVDPDTYTGERPFGSDRVPLGLDGGPLDITPRASEEVPIWPNERIPEYIVPGSTAEARAGDRLTPQDRADAEVVTGAGLGNSAGLPSVAAGPTDEAINLSDPTAPLFERDRLWGKDVEAPGAEVGGASATGRTADEYLETSESWAERQASRAKFAKSQAEWNDRKSRVATDFGDDAVATWDAYFDLPKGDARKQYMKDHPEMKLYNVAAFNPDEYKAAKELFAQEDLMSWVNVPAWDGTEETDDLRRQYYQEHPTAFVVHSWMNGRPSERDDDKGYDEEKGTSYFDFGKDYALAQEKFGDDIWQLVAQYKAIGDDKQARAQFFDEHENFDAWNDWWYGNMPQDEYDPKYRAKRSGPGYDSLGHRAFGSWGGGGGGGGGYGGGGGEYAPRVELPYIQPRGMSGNLWEAPYVRQWRPDWLDMPRAPEIERRQLRQWR